MTNKEMLCTALKQSALELNCTVDDLTGGKSKAVISSTAEGARKYLSLPFYCQLVSYGSGIVASVNEEIYADAKAYIENTRRSIALKRLTCSFCSPRLSGGA